MKKTMKRNAIEQSAKNYETITEWLKGDRLAYQVAQRLGVIDEVTVDMRRDWEKKWTEKEAVVENAKKYSTKTEWRIHSNGAYHSALRNYWMVEATAHMKKGKPRIKRANIDAVIEDARKYETKFEWRKNSSGAYQMAVKLGIFEEAVAHMRILRKRWTNAQIVESTILYSDYKLWKQENPSAYFAASRRGLLNKLNKILNQKKITFLADIETV